MPAPTAETTHPADDVLAREQAHLDHARDQLRRMREATDRLDAEKATDAWTSELLGRVLARRVASLQDDPRTTLFFGRIDMRTEHGDETFHIGRRHVARRPRRPGGRRLAGADLHARSTGPRRPQPMGVELRRRFGVDRGRLTAYEDERLTARRRHRATAPSSPREIERPRVGPMRDIVSTIQPEQDEIVRSDLATSICVQGAPGTGKTAVGLHRAAWLLYSFRARLDRSGVLVVGPNRAFLDHIGAVLPSLGEARVGHATIDALLDHGPGARRRTPPRSRCSRATRGSPRCCTAPCGRTSAAPTRRSSCRAGHAAGGCRPTRSQEIVDALVTRGRALLGRPRPAPPAARPPVLLQMERAGDSPDDRVQDTVARSAPVTAYVRHAVAGARPGRRALPAPLGCRGARRRAPTASSPTTSSALLLWHEASSHARARPAGRAADLALLDEVADLLDRTPSLGHVVLDEAQDLSPMQLRAVGRRASTGSLTVLGDIAQGTTPWATQSWEDAMRHLGRPAPRARGARPRLPRAGGWSSTSPRGCCRTWLRAWGRRGRCATTRAG